MAMLSNSSSFVPSQFSQAVFDPKNIEFGLVNNRNQFNCYINSILQIIWHVEVLKDSIHIFSQLGRKENTPEYNVIECIQRVFEDAYNQHHEVGQKKIPVINADNLRVQTFKFFYAEQDPEKFDLYKKADSSEFLQSILELSHYCLNENANKKDVD